MSHRVLEVKTLNDGRVVTVYAPGAQSGSKAPSETSDHVTVLSAADKPLRSISPRQAQQLITAGLAFPLSRNLSGELPGWRERKRYQIHAIKLTAFLSGEFDPTAITSQETRANAGEFGEEAMWAIAARDKIAAWPSVGDTKAVRVGIRI
jgi:hypothetical protein